MKFKVYFLIKYFEFRRLRNQISNLYFLVFVISLVLGIVFGILEALIVFPLLILMLIYLKKFSGLIFIFGFILGLVYLAGYKNNIETNLKKYENSELKGEEIILEENASSSQFSQSAIGKLKDGNLVYLSNLPRYPNLGVGVRVVVSGQLQRLDLSNGFDKYLFSKKVLFKVKIEDFKLESQSKNLKSSFNKFRNLMISQVNSRLEPKNAILVNGILFGDANYFNDELKDDLKVSGIYHIFSVSGSNFAFLYLLAKYFTKHLPIKFSRLLSVIVLLFYLLIVGPYNIPALRAFLFISFLITLEHLGRRISVLYLFILAISLLIISNPYIIFNLSFQLTLAINGGLLILGNKFSKMLRKSLKHEILSTTLALTLISSLVSSPILYLYFKEITLVSFIANLAIIYIVTPILIFSVFLIIYPANFEALNFVINSFCNCLNFLTENFGGLEFLVIRNNISAAIFIFSSFTALIIFDYLYIRDLYEKKFNKIYRK